MLTRRSGELRLQSRINGAEQVPVWTGAGVERTDLLYRRGKASVDVYIDVWSSGYTGGNHGDTLHLQQEKHWPESQRKVIHVLRGHQEEAALAHRTSYVRK